MEMSTCELKACLRARKISAIGKKYILRGRLLERLQLQASGSFESTKLNENDSLQTLDSRALALQQENELLRKLDEENRKKMIAKFTNRVRRHGEPFKQYFYTMVGMANILDLSLKETCCAIIAGLQNDEVSSVLAGVKFDSLDQLYKRLNS